MEQFVYDSVNGSDFQLSMSDCLIDGILAESL